MRIRSIKPEFWRSPVIAGLEWELIYDGPVPRRVNLVAPMVADAEYVYLLFDAEGGLLYAGRSFRPADRFTKHYRKEWWADVAGAAFVKVQEDPASTRERWACGPNTARFEAYAIETLSPRANIAAPARRVLR